MKALEQYFPVVLFIMLYKVVLTFEFVDEILSVTIQMKALEQYFPVVLFVMLFKVVLSFVSLGEILTTDSPSTAMSSTFRWCSFLNIVQDDLWHFFVSSLCVLGSVPVKVL